MQLETGSKCTNRNVIDPSARQTYLRRISGVVGTVLLDLNDYAKNILPPADSQNIVMLAPPKVLNREKNHEQSIP